MMKEPEEVIETKVIEMLRIGLAGVDVLGALSPVPDGEQKQSPDTYVSVFADLASQNLDWRGAGVPCTYAVRVTVHFANADDATGAGFRDTCRKVRRALYALTGDGCMGLDGSGFLCSAFVFDSTSTTIDQDFESGGMTKTYNATVTGRFTTNNNQEA